MGHDQQHAAVDVCVIGGGWAGIAAAIEACAAGCSVSLIEAAPQLGGRARTVEIDMGFGPVRLDNGQHLMMGAYRETLALMERVTPDARQRLCREPLALRDPDGLALVAASLPAPLHLAVAFARARGFGWAGRVACVRLMLNLWRHSWQVPDGETVAQLLERTGQPPWLIERLWNPLCVSALNTPTDIACARTFSAVLRDTLGGARAASDFILPIDTLGDCLPDPATAWLTARGAGILLRTPARSMRQSGSEWHIALPDGVLRARAVVLALPAANSDRLMGSAVDSSNGQRIHALREALSAFQPIPIATTYLAWPEAGVGPLPRWTMLGKRRQQAGDAPRGDWLFDRGVQRGHRIASVVVSNANAPEESLGALTAAVGASAVQALRLPAPAHAFTVFERRATFACVPGRPLITQPIGGNLPGLWLAGDYTERDYPATIESAVRSGLRAGALAARLIAQTPEQPPSQDQATDSA
jgi:squalene-associated FAD-dependent desaturase